MNFTKLFLTLMNIFSVLNFSCCGDQFMAKTSESERSTPLSLQTDAAGNVSSAVPAAGGTIGTANGSVSFPPGSLSVSTNVTVGVGASFAVSTIGSELGVSGNNFTSASSALAVISDSSNPVISSPMTISVGFSPASLNLLGNENYVIVFRATKSDGKKIIGTIPSTQLTINNAAVYFQAKYWGVYQHLKVDVPIVQTIVKDSLISPTLKADPTVSAPAISGTYAAGCNKLGFYPNAGAAAPQSRTATMTFGANATFTRNESEFVTTDCSGSVSHNKSITGSYKTGFLFGSGFALDVNLTTVSEIYNDAGLVAGANQYLRCGLNNWVIGLSKDVGNCPDNKGPKANSIYYTIYSLDSTGTIMRLGSDKDQTVNSAATRTTDLDPDPTNNLTKK